MPTTDIRLKSIRKFLLGIFLLALLGTVAELLLLEHTGDLWQLVPLLLSGLSVLSLLWFAVDRRPVLLRIFQGTMILFFISGVIGVWLHYRVNVEFEREVYPALEGFALFRKALKGATPTLASGTMSVLGLLGLIYTYEHPVLKTNHDKNHKRREEK